jgi:hypothetical protein
MRGTKRMEGLGVRDYGVRVKELEYKDQWVRGEKIRVKGQGVRE